MRSTAASQTLYIPRHGGEAAELQVATVRLSELSTHPENPRRGDLDAIKESFERHGQYQPLVVNGRTMEVLAGNHRLMAARELGWDYVAVVFVDVDEETARQIVLVDNRTSDLADYDLEALLELLGSVEELDGTGYDERALDDLLDELVPPPLAEEEVPHTPAEARTKPGEVLALGDHRLVCGDARDLGSYRALLGDEAADVLVTDPPYGVDYEGRTSARLRIENDAPDDLERLLEQSLACIDSVLRPGAPLYLFHPSGAQSAAFINAFRAQGWSLRQTLIWLKLALVMGRSDYHYRHEPILYGFKPGEGRLGRGGAGWYGGNRQSSVLEVDRPVASREHPTMKPPELVEIALRNSSRRGEIVLDPFAGSGSTLVACHRLGCRARLIELDPGYCDVIVERYERLTGLEAEVL